MNPTDPPEFNPQVPLPDTNIPNGQKLLLDNFKTIYDAFLTNHISLDDPTNPGNHNVIQLLEQTQKQATESQEIAIYSKKVDGQTDQLFMRYQGNGKEFQLTQYQIYQIEATPTQISYFTFLPGGIIVYFGRVNPTGNNFPINLNPAICGNILGVNLCPIGGVSTGFVQSNVSLTTTNEGKFNTIQLTSTTNNANQYYLAFGNI